MGSDFERSHSELERDLLGSFEHVPIGEAEPLTDDQTRWIDGGYGNQTTDEVYPRADESMDEYVERMRQHLDD